MKKLVVKSTLSRSIPLQGKQEVMNIPSMGTVILDENYYDHFHFTSLKKKGILKIVREEIPQEKPKEYLPQKAKAEEEVFEKKRPSKKKPNRQRTQPKQKKTSEESLEEKPSEELEMNGE